MQKSIVAPCWREDERGYHYRDPKGDITYHMAIVGDLVVVNGKSLPIMYEEDTAVRLLKTRIYSLYSPAEFFAKFFKDGTWYVWAKIVCAHVVKYGKPLEVK